MTTVYHILAEEKGWKVSREDTKTAVSHHKTRREAIKEARKLAKERESVEVIVHGPDGEVEKRLSFGD